MEDLWDTPWGHSDLCPQLSIAGVLALGCTMGERSNELPESQAW